MAQTEKGYGKTFPAPEYKASTLADATTMALTITSNHEYVAIDTMAQNGTLNLTIDSNVVAGATLKLKVTSDTTARTLTLGTGTDTSVVYGIASQSKYLLLEYDGSTYNLRREFPERFQTTFNVGAAATGSTAVEYGDSRNHVTVLTVSTALPAITGGAEQGLGKLVYTFPAGCIVVKAAYMSMSLTQTEAHINNDTPDGGLGTTIASGIHDLLSEVSGSENILTGQTFNNCTGTAEVKTVADQPLAIETGGNHTVYFNVADDWAASGDAACAIAGTIKLIWTFLG
jgi:hypothetical protein